MRWSPVFDPKALKGAIGANQGGMRGPSLLVLRWGSETTVMEIPELWTAMKGLKTMAQTRTKFAVSCTQAKKRQRIGGHPHSK